MADQIQQASMVTRLRSPTPAMLSMLENAPVYGDGDLNSYLLNGKLANNLAGLGSVNANGELGSVKYEGVVLTSIEYNTEAKTAVVSFDYGDAATTILVRVKFVAPITVADLRIVLPKWARTGKDSGRPRGQFEVAPPREYTLAELSAAIDDDEPVVLDGRMLPGNEEIVLSAVPIVSVKRTKGGLEVETIHGSRMLLKEQPPTMIEFDRMANRERIFLNAAKWFVPRAHPLIKESLETFVAAAIRHGYEMQAVSKGAPPGSRTPE